MYIRAIKHIYAAYLRLSPRPPLIVNTMGWMKGKKKSLFKLDMDDDKYSIRRIFAYSRPHCLHRIEV